MILSDLASYLSEQKRAALTDISHRLGSDQEVLRMMLAVLERKGRVRKLPTGTACPGGCCKCDAALVEIYEWVEGEAES